MENFLFNHLNFARNVTLRIAQEVTEEQADIIPEGFNNNIRWNLGHIYLIQEQFAFHFIDEPKLIPDGFRELFGLGTKPADWTIQPPTLSEIIELLQEQPVRIKEKLENRLTETLTTPFTFPGLAMNTVGEILTLSLYHEGAHAETIKALKKLSTK
ncbi:DinB family protein [Aneurinibacillus uraniidurans]|uniref:DinB family protein n=1 Tax=Aneurinibacillus uraniidurans TaxID=2966586 RepID=UPI00234AD13A|nr:DinB family protein [Aneurinibacillus sp. B1]WCN39357.1 DinB family protein [Aneurinibacillus sp. B1]